MNKKNQKGVTLIEALAGILILAILIFGVYGMYDYSLKMVREKSRREEAVAVANEEMEYFRSIDYDVLGTAATICAPNPEGCDVSPAKTIVRNGVNYTVLTDISYVDDIFDNADNDPEGDDDTGLNDYKTARVEVRWDSTFSNNSVILVSTFAPIGIETDCGGGILKINVVDENMQPVPQAGVYIKNDNIGYEYDTKTNNEGRFRKGCFPEDLNNNYEITINKPPKDGEPHPFYKSDYSTAQTCPTGVGTPNPICPKLLLDNATPDPQHVNINEGGITEITFFIDRLSALNVTTITQNLPVEWTVNESVGDGETQDMPTMAIGPDDTYYFFWRGDDGGQERIYGQKYNSSRVALWGSGSDVQITTANDEDFPSITVDANGNVYAAWYHASGGNQETYIEKLASGTGLPIWNVTLVVTTTNTNDDQSEPKIGLEDDENFIYLTYLDNSDDTNDLYTARFATTDGSQEWTDETKMNDDSNGNIQDSQSILVEPDTDDLVAVWHDNRDGDNDIYAQKINSYGHYSDEIQISVESDIIADTTSRNGLILGTLIYEDPDSGVSDDSYIFVDGGNGIYDGTETTIGIESDTDSDTTSLNGPLVGTLIYEDPDANTSDDSYIFVDANDSEDYDDGEIKISVEGDTIADTTSFNDAINGDLTYLDPDSETANDSYIFADANGDAICNTWGFNIKINEDYGGKEQSYPAIAMLQESGNKFLYIVWQDYRNDNFDIYLTKYNNDGTRLWEDDIYLTSTNSDQTMPAIAINPNDNVIYIAWVDKKNGNPDIYMQKFNTSGDALWNDDLRVNNDQTLGGSTQGAPQLAINSLDEVVVTWQDNDAGDYDIRAAVVTDPVPIIEGDVPLRIYGSKTIGKDASENNIYKFDSTFTTDSNGELKFDGNDQPKLEWDSYTIEINGESYNLLRTEPPIPITIGPNTANDIILIVEQTS